MIDAQKLYEEAVADCVRLQGRSLRLELGVGEAMILVAHNQLALRHPDNRGGGTEIATNIANAVISGMEQLSPKVAEFLRIGFDTRFDVPAGGSGSRAMGL